MKLDPITEYILEQDKEIQEGLFPAITANMVAGRLILTLGKEAQNILAGVILFGSILIAIKIISEINQFYRDVISKYGRRCSSIKLGTYDRKKCELSVKVKALEMRIKALADAKKYCKKTKEPQKCVSKVNEHIKEVSKRLDKAKNKLKELQQYRSYTG